MNKKTRDLEFKIKAVDDDGFFSGYGSVFGNVDSYGDVVVEGAFDETIKDHQAKGVMPPVLWQHYASEPIGVFTKLEEDEHGLYVEGKLLINDIQKAREAHSLLKAGAISGLSIGYSIKKGNWNEADGIYELLAVKLFEISVVTFPANEESVVETVKSKLQDGKLPSLPEFEKSLRDLGFSKKQAVAIASRGLKPLLGEPAEKQQISNTLKILETINKGK